MPHFETLTQQSDAKDRGVHGDPLEQIHQEYMGQKLDPQGNGSVSADPMGYA